MANRFTVWVCRSSDGGNETVGGTQTSPICPSPGIWIPIDIPKGMGPSPADATQNYVWNRFDSLDVSLTDLQTQINTIESTGGGGGGTTSVPFDPSTLDPATLTAAFSSGFAVVLFFWAATIGFKWLLNFIKEVIHNV